MGAGLEDPAPLIREMKMNEKMIEKVETPTLEELMEWESQGYCEALDGCIVEPDGHCEHGKPSWLLHLGMI